MTPSITQQIAVDHMLTLGPVLVLAVIFWSAALWWLHWLDGIDLMASIRSSAAEVATAEERLITERGYDPREMLLALREARP